MKIISFLILCVLASSWCAYAQTAESAANSFSSDRAGASESPFVTPRRTLQLEWGFSQERQAVRDYQFMYASTHATTYSALLLRYAIHERVEIRLSSDLGNRETTTLPGFCGSEQPTPEKIPTGFWPLRLGLKANISKNVGARPALALLSELSLPQIASEKHQTTTRIITNRLAGQNELNKHFHLFYNLGATFLCGSRNDMGLFYSLGLRYTPFKPISVFAETYTNDDLLQFAEVGGFSSPMFWNIGLTLRPFNYLQIDASYGGDYKKPKPYNYDGSEQPFLSGQFSFGVAYRFFAKQERRI